MSVFYAATWLLIFTMDCAVCLNSSVTIEASVTEYSLAHTVNQTSSPSESLSEASPLEPSNTISNQVTATLMFQPLSPTEVSQQSSMPVLIEPSSKSLITESATHLTESSPTSVGSTPIAAELSPTLFTSPSTSNDSSTHLFEPTSTSVEPPLASDREAAMSQSFHEMSSLPSLWSPSDTLLMASEYLDIPSTDLTSSVSSYYTYTFSASIEIENRTIPLSSFDDFTVFETMPRLPSTNATNTPFESIPDLSHSLYSVASTVEVTTQTVPLDNFTAIVEDTTHTVSPDSITSIVENTIQTVSPHSVESTVEDTTQTMPLDNFTAIVEDTTHTVSPGSVTATAEDTTQTVNNLETSTLSGYEPVASLFSVPESSSGYNPMTFETASVPESIFTDISPIPDSITSVDTVSLVTTMVPRVETIASHQTAAITPATTVMSSSSVITNPTSSPTESTSPVQDLPDKSSKGLSTGGKVAIGIIIPLAIIGLIILGIFFYRRYNWNRGSFKNFLQPGVHYRAYTNETFTDDDDATMGGSWRKMSDS